jgi:hypothetical protein
MFGRIIAFLMKEEQEEEEEEEFVLPVQELP